MPEPRSTFPLISPPGGLPYDLLAYEQWLRECHRAPTTDGYLFTEPRVRFAPEPDDVLVLLVDTTYERQDSCLLLRHPAGATVVLADLEPGSAERIIHSIDGQRCLLSVQLAAAVTEAEMDAFLRAAFGRFVFCPTTVLQFERRIAASSLVRFPGSPYELNRAYWSNMADVRDAWQREQSTLEDMTAFFVALRRYHVLSLIGATGRSFYRPSSPILAKAGARAGTFYDTPTRTVQEGDLTLFIDGPRVSAPFVGGREYHELLCRSLGDPGALAPSRQIHDASGLDWGRVTIGRARSDPEPRAWFVPPRPIGPGHLERLFDEYRCALSAQSTDALSDALAALHWHLIRLHPFVCANQSLAMNLIGGLLGHHGRSAIPHLLLDQMALRFDQLAYARLFRRALCAWSTRNDASFSERQQQLIRKRATMEEFVGNLPRLGADASVERYVNDAREAARLALLTD